MVDWVGLTVPIAYLSILVGSLATFSSLYRKRKVAKSISLEPWFPPHLQRDIYLSLLHLEPSPTQEKNPAVPDSVLKAALLQRAAEDIRRILSIRNAKPALGNLLGRGSVGDDLWQRFLRAEKEIEAELRDVVEEANGLSPTWGQSIFQSANEMVQAELTHKRLEELQEQGKKDRERWDAERADIQAQFNKEHNIVDDASAGAGASNTTPGTDKSDEDAVLVDGGGPAAGGAKGGTKKRKVKK